MRPTLLIALVVTLTGCASAAKPASSTATPTVVDTTTTTTAPTTTTSTTTTTSAAPTTTTVVAGSVPRGWNLFEGAYASIAAPPGWIDGKAFLNDPDDREAVVDAVQEQLVDDYFDQLGAEVFNLLDVMLLDVTNATPEFVDNVNVIVSDGDPLTDLGLIEAGVPSVLRSFGATLSATKSDEVAGIETLVVDYQLEMVTGLITGRQYYQIRDDRIITVTFTGRVADYDLWDEMITTVALS